MNRIYMVTVGLAFLVGASAAEAQDHAGTRGIQANPRLTKLVSELACPSNILTPAGVPSYQVIPSKKEEKPYVLFPAAAYQELYFEAWNEQLYQYGILKLSPALRARMSSVTSFGINSGGGATGAIKGGLDCYKRIEKLRKEFGDTLTRQAARLAYIRRANPVITWVHFSPEEFEDRDPNTTYSLDLEFHVAPNCASGTEDETNEKRE